jgi:2-polyprenyl-3-methyl-5-hydroxy-6-metoxy-1,4-benzoquinol methylase
MTGSAPGSLSALAARHLKRIGLAAAPRVIRLIPGPVLPFVTRIHRPLASYLAGTHQRRKYGGRFDVAIHPDDDLLHHAFPLADAYPVLRYYRAAQMYFEGGEWNADEVERVLEDAGFSLRQADSLLEFASGYGRLTRHLVHKLSASKITVADLDPSAVDFLKRTLGVKGFYSTSAAEALDHDGRYDMIVVVSLFSHLPNQSWGPWLKRLSGLLRPGGVLMFSTHNFDDCDPKDFEVQADGILYRNQNETRGRLDPTQYGAAFVSESYVQRVVAENFDGRMVGFFPHALLISQDAYVVQRAGAGAPDAPRHGRAPARV